MHYLFKTVGVFTLFTLLAVADVKAANSNLQQDAALYQTRCVQCHPIEMAKVVNGQVLPSEVFTMVKRMQDMPGSLMKPSEFNALYQYSVFDVYANQRDELKARLASLSPAEKQKEISALKQALSRYK